VQKVFKRSAGDHEVILPHADKQTPLPKVVLHDENLIAFHQNEGVISPDLVHDLQDLLLGPFAPHQSLVEPFPIILPSFLINGRQIPIFPDFPIEQKIGSWCLADIAVLTSEMKNRLNSQCIAVLNFDRLFTILQNIIVSLVHIDTVRYYFVRPSSAQNVLHVCKVGHRREQ